MEKIKKVLDFVTSRGFMLIAIVVLILLFLRQCGVANDAEKEAKREHNNYLASIDSVRTIKKERDHAIYEKSAFQLKVSELTQEQTDLIKDLCLKSNGIGTTPKTVIQYVVEYREVVKNIPSTVDKDPDGSESITFLHNPELKGKNKLKIAGKVPYSVNILRDSTDSTKYFAEIIPGGTTLDIEQSIDIVTGVYMEPKSKRIMTRVSTTFPNLTFSEINSFDITDSPETRQLMKSARKQFGLGLNLGYGLNMGTNGINPGVYVGIGLHYSPRFLQFGK
jgi:hypothetical protein